MQQTNRGRKGKKIPMYVAEGETPSRAHCRYRNLPMGWLIFFYMTFSVLTIIWVGPSMGDAMMEANSYSEANFTTDEFREHYHILSERSSNFLLISVAITGIFDKYQNMKSSAFMFVMTYVVSTVLIFAGHYTWLVDAGIYIGRLPLVFGIRFLFHVMPMVPDYSAVVNVIISGAGDMSFAAPKLFMFLSAHTALSLKTWIWIFLVFLLIPLGILIIMFTPKSWNPIVHNLRRYRGEITEAEYQEGILASNKAVSMRALMGDLSVALFGLKGICFMFFIIIHMLRTRHLLDSLPVLVNDAMDVLGRSEEDGEFLRDIFDYSVCAGSIFGLIFGFVMMWTNFPVALFVLNCFATVQYLVICSGSFWGLCVAGALTGFGNAVQFSCMSMFVKYLFDFDLSILNIYQSAMLILVTLVNIFAIRWRGIIMESFYQNNMYYVQQLYLWATYIAFIPVVILIIHNFFTSKTKKVMALSDCESSTSDSKATQYGTETKIEA